MSVPYYGDFAEDDTVYIPFNTFTSDDPSASVTVTNLAAGDVEIHKDGGTTQKASSDGVTVSIDFDGITGCHLITLDTSDDTGAAGFWVTGSEYQVRLEGITVDGATLNPWIGAFSIERGGGGIELLTNATYGLDALETIVSDVLSTLDDNVASELTAIKSDVTAVYSSLSDFEATIVSDVTAVKSSVSDVLAMTTGNSNIISQILVDTATTLDDKIDSVLADTKEINSQCDSILADTQTLSNATYGLDALETLCSQILTDTGTTLDNKVDSILSTTASILVDTGTTLENRTTSIVDQTSDLISNLSNVLSTLDGAGIKPTTAEPAAGAPSKTAATGVKIDYLYTVFRNKIETTSGTQKVYDDAGTGVLFSCALSDDATTFTKAEHV